MNSPHTACRGAALRARGADSIVSRLVRCEYQREVWSVVWGDEVLGLDKLYHHPMDHWALDARGGVAAVHLLLCCVPPVDDSIYLGVAEAPRSGGARDVVELPTGSGAEAACVFLLLAYMITVATSTMYSFFGIYIRDIEGTTSLLGTAFSLSAISDMPIIAFSGLLLRWLGPRKLLLIAVISYAVRLGVYGFLPDPRRVILVQLMHGLCSGGYLCPRDASPSLVGRELAATAQAMLASVSMGFGSIMGSIVGGALLDIVGTVGIYRLASGVMLLALVVLLLSMRLLSEGDVEKPSLVTAQLQESTVRPDKLVRQLPT